MDQETADQVIEQLRSLTTQVRALERDNELLRAGSSGSDSEVAPKGLLAKWAPDPYNGDPPGWRRWALKFKTFIGALKGGAIGRWIQHVEDNRGDSALNASFDDIGAKQASIFLYSSLLGSTEDRALTVVERVGVGEGLEAWRMLLDRFDRQTRQSKVMKMVALLSFDLRGDDIADALEKFERACAMYEGEFGEPIKDDVKIGIVCKGLAPGMMKEHMLMLSERCESWIDFKRELDLVSRARQANKEKHTPMDLDVVTKGKGEKGKKGDKNGKGKSGGKGKKNDRETRTCWYCNKTGHLERDCWSKPSKGSSGSSSKGAAKGKKGGKSKSKVSKKGEIKSMEEEYTEATGEPAVLAGLLMALDEEPDWDPEEEPQEKKEEEKEDEKEEEEESSYEYYSTEEEEAKNKDENKKEAKNKDENKKEAKNNDENKKEAKNKDENKKHIEETVEGEKMNKPQSAKRKEVEKEARSQSAKETEDEKRSKKRVAKLEVKTETRRRSAKKWKGEKESGGERKCFQCRTRSALQPCEIRGCHSFMCASCGCLVEDQGKIFILCTKHFKMYYEEEKESAEEKNKISVQRESDQSAKSRRLGRGRSREPTFKSRS